MTRTFVAPGKLMIAGEYSVLGPGGEALAIAVEPGIEAEATPGPQWEILRGDGQASWTEGAFVPEQLVFAHAAWEEARLSLGAGDLPAHRIVTRARGDIYIDVNAGKPGVGGSASATAVVSAALYGLAGRDPGQHREQVLAAALRAHGRVQQGMGSGYDVATVVHGGLVHFERPAQARRLPWPAGLHLLAGYSGKSARTTQLLDRLGPLDDGPGELADPTRRLVEAFERGDLQSITEQVSCCHAALRTWDARRGLGVMTPEIERMVHVAASVGAAAKVSGAGGGDSVVALATDPAVLEAVASGWREGGFHPLSLDIGVEGVRELIE
jgi:phosphomevalonate kinase